MGRHALNHCHYFPHQTSMRNHRKVKALKNKFDKPGCPIGYAFWSMFLEYLTGLDGHEMEYNDLECEMFASELGISGETIKEMIEYCLKIELLFDRDGFIYSPSLEEKLAPVYEKRNKSKESSASRRRKESGKFQKKSESPGQVSLNISSDDGIVSTDNIQVITEKPQIRIDKNRIDKNRPEYSEILVSCNNFFSDWYAKKEKKICDFDVADSKSLKRIVERIENQFIDKEISLQEFKNIFENYESWGELYKNKLKFSQIEYYWQDIIQSLKLNGIETKIITFRESFEKFWANYDKNVGRYNCEKLWVELTPREIIEILEYIPGYILSTPDKRFRVNPQKFLEEKMWLNEIIPAKLNGTKNGTSKKFTTEDYINSGKKIWGKGD